MSKKGIKIFAKVLSDAQQARGKLLNIGTNKKKIGTKEGNQDIQLAQLLEIMKDSIKKDFMKITLI